MFKHLLHSLPGKILFLAAIALLTLIAIVGIRSAVAGNEPASTQTVGWVENVKMTNIEFPIEAKLDTGATTTSLNAEILEKPSDEVESGGLVRFNFVDGEGNKTLFERPLTRWVDIKGEGRRPVVQMSFCLAGEWVEGEVNLAERDQFNYAVLVGRNLLKERRLAVDSAQTFTLPDSSQRACEQEESE